MSKFSDFSNNTQTLDSEKELAEVLPETTVHQLASNLDREGMPLEEVVRRVIADCTSTDFSAEEIRAAISRSYQCYEEEFSELQMPQMPQMPRRVFEIEDDNTSLTFPSSVYGLLPPFLKDITDKVSDSRDKDLILISSIAALSGVFPNVSGKYSNDKTYANIFLFVVAPAASGKSIIKYSFKLLESIHNEWKQESDERIESYYRESKGQKNPTLPPTYRILEISPNISHSALIDTLMANDGVGVMCSTEADDMSTSWRSDWSNFSETLRKSFHHEKVSYSRKTGRQYAEVEKPKLSVLLSGTPDQVARLIGSASNGLFSRFLYYTYDVVNQWKNVFEEGESLDDTFKDFGVLVHRMWNHYMSKDGIVFTFNETQESRLNDLGMNMLDSTNNLHLTSDAISSIPKRLGLIFFRMAMVLTCVRNYGPEVEVPTTLECSDDDFDICMTLIPLFLQHSLKILEQLPGEIESRGAEQAARQLLRELPTGVNLTRPEIENCSSTRLSRSALSKYLKILVRLKLLTSPIHGVYVKPA